MILMNIVLISNYFNHHQKCIGDALYRLTDGQFSFIATQQISEMRRALGYKEMTADYVVSPTSETCKQELKLISESEVVIAGSASGALLKGYIQSGKPLFRYSEHPLKTGNTWYKYPIRWWRWHKNNPPKVPIYMLCASAYTAGDYAKFGLFKGKTYKWGYFPECKRYENIEALLQKKDPRQILWCGRFLDWKHPDDVLTVAKRLKEENYSFHIQMIGTGEMEEELKAQILRDGLSEHISLLGSMSPEKVREHMERAGIYLFTSDRKEGWGAVLNEAMNSGCAVVASLAAGSTPYLIRHEENGLSYPACDADALYAHIKYLLEHSDVQRHMGRAAYHTIVSEWNAEVAAVRFIQLAERILQGEESLDLFQSGPCSKA